VVGFRVVQRDVFDIQRHALVVGDEFERIVDDSEGAETQKVHLEQPHGFDVIHGVLRHDFAFGPFGEWYDIVQRFWRDHHSGGVHRGMA
jgi:hypothetical protein